MSISFILSCRKDKQAKRANNNTDTYRNVQEFSGTIRKNVFTINVMNVYCKRKRIRLLISFHAGISNSSYAELTANENELGNWQQAVCHRGDHIVHNM